MIEAGTPATRPLRQPGGAQIWLSSRSALAAMVGATLAFQVWVLAVRPQSAFLKYPAAAERWLSGELSAERVADFSPAYFSLHIGLRQLLGASAATTTAALLQVVLIACASGLLLRWAVATLDLPPTRLAFAAILAAALLWMLNPGLLVYGSVLEPEALLLFLLSALLFVAQRGGAGPGPGLSLLAGALCAACIATRPTLLAAAALAPLGWWLVASPAEARDRRRWRRATLLFLLPVVVVLLALSLRSAASGGRFSPSVMNPGTVFFEGNHPLSWGSSGVYPPAHYELGSGEAGGRPDAAHDHYRRLARVASGRDLTITEVNRYWAGKALAFIVDHPGRWLRTELAKLGALARGFEEHDLAIAYGIDGAIGRGGVPRLPFPLLGLVGLWGMIAARRRWRELVLVYGLVLSQALAMMVFYVSSRQRLTLLPPLFLFAAFGIADLGARGRRGLLGGLLIVAASLALLPASERRADRRHHLSTQRMAGAFARGAQSARAAGDLEAASRLAVQALAVAPTLARSARPSDLGFPGGYARSALQVADADGAPADDSAALDRAVLAALAGDIERAAAELGELPLRPRFYRGAMTSSEPELWRARLELAVGIQPEAVVRRLENLLAHAPGEPFALAELYALTEDAEVRRRLERYFDSTSASLLVGRAHLRHGRWQLAAAELAIAARAAPEMRGVWLDLAAAFSHASELADLERGRDAYLRAMALGGEPLVHEQQIVELFDRLAVASAGDFELARDPEVARLQARVLRQYGHYREALEVLNAAISAGLWGEELAVKPGAEIEAEVEWLERALSR